MNLFEITDLPGAAEVIDRIVDSNASGVRIERIVSTGQTSDWYNQAQHEFVALLTGNAVIEYDNGETVALKPGDTLIIERFQRHRVTFTSTHPAAIWLCVFYD